MASRKYRDMWKKELSEHPELFSTSILSTHETRSQAVDAELEWQLKHRVVESEEFMNMAYAKARFYGLSTPDLVEAFRTAIASRSDEAQQAISEMARVRQRRFLSSRTPEQVKMTAEKQAESLRINHSKRSDEQRQRTAERKRNTLAKHDQNWHNEVNARRSASQRASHAARRNGQ